VFLVLGTVTVALSQQKNPEKDDSPETKTRDREPGVIQWARMGYRGTGTALPGGGTRRLVLDSLAPGGLAAGLLVRKKQVLASGLVAGKDRQGACAEENLLR